MMRAKTKVNNMFSNLGDGALTPAISVLSAVEGIATTTESMKQWVLPITVLIILLLFFVQMFGTSKIGNKTIDPYQSNSLIHLF